MITLGINQRICRRAAAGTTPEIVEFLTLPNWIDAIRSRLSLGRGWPWETVRVERAAFGCIYKHASPGYHLFHAAVLAIAAVISPTFFHRGRDWYAKRWLARVRGVLGTDVLPDSLVVRKAYGR